MNAVLVSVALNDSPESPGSVVKHASSPVFDAKVIELSQTNVLLGFDQVTLAEPLDAPVKCTISFEKSGYYVDAMSGSLHGRLFTPESNKDRTSLERFLGQVRKDQHIAICKSEEIESRPAESESLFSKIPLVYRSLPDANFNDQTHHVEFFGCKFSWPFLITGMTGGVSEAESINHRLATGAVELNIPMGVGSQRIAVDDKNLEGAFKLKRSFPRLKLIGNLGIAQLVKPDGLSLALRCIDMIEADAFAIHVNVLQELIQMEGDRDFSNAFQSIAELVKATSVPVLVKEVGFGLDPKTIQNLFDCGVRLFDVGGKGGTSWSKIEGLRSAHPEVTRLGQRFGDWGLSTEEALRQAIKLGLKDVSFVATGGMRSGIDALKAVRAGATMVGFGLPLFKAALKSEEAVVTELRLLAKEFQIANFLTYP